MMPFIKTGDIDTFYEEYGNGVPLILIHGGWVDHRMWQFQVEELSKKCHLIIYDLRAHGKTSTGSSPYTMQQLADDLKSLLDKLNIEKAYIGGLSLGGMVTQVFATTYPERVKGIILIDTGASTSLGWIEVLLKYVLVPRPVFRLLIKTLGVPLFAALTFRIAGIAAAKKKSKNRKTKKTAASYARREIERHTAESYTTIMYAVYGFKLQPLHKITQPVLLIWGEKDSFLVHRQMKFLQKKLPQNESHIIARTGHVPNMERPGVFNDLVLRFCG